MQGSIPKITMRDIWRKEKRSGIKISLRFGLGNFGDLVQKIKELEDVAASDIFDVSKFAHKKQIQSPKIATVQYEPKIECIPPDIIENYNCKGDLGVFLRFIGLSFLEDSFTKSEEDYRRNMCVYSTNVSYKNERASLRLSTIGDILESEVVQKKKGIDQLFYDEIYIPKLTKVYDPLSMEPVQKNGLVMITYKKLNEIGTLPDIGSQVKSRNSFTINIDKDVNAVLKRVKRNALAYGINFQGDAVSGTFSWKDISAKYHINGQEITIYIDKKPPFVTNDFVKDKIINYLIK